VLEERVVVVGVRAVAAVVVVDAASSEANVEVSVAVEVAGTAVMRVVVMVVCCTESSSCVWVVVETAEPSSPPLPLPVHLSGHFPSILLPTSSHREQSKQSTFGFQGWSSQDQQLEGFTDNVRIKSMHYKLRRHSLL
jgi:hypothetical protein